MSSYLKIATILLLGSLASINCDGWFKKCADPKTASNFNLDEISGFWYLYGSSNVGESKCTTLDYEVVNNTIVRSTIRGWIPTMPTGFSMNFDMIYDPSVYGLGKLNIPSYDNPLLKMYFGEETVSVVDFNPTNYFLVFTCKYQYFGLKSTEQVYTFTKSPELDAPSQYRVKKLVESFSYSGKPMQKVDRNPQICNNPMPLTN